LPVTTGVAAAAASAAAANAWQHRRLYHRSGRKNYRAAHCAAARRRRRHHAARRISQLSASNAVPAVSVGASAAALRTVGHLFFRALSRPGGERRRKLYASCAAALMAAASRKSVYLSEHSRSALDIMPSFHREVGVDISKSYRAAPAAPRGNSASRNRRCLSPIDALSPRWLARRDIFYLFCGLQQ